MLLPLSYVLGMAAFVGLIVCVALGLLRVCDYMEESPNHARRVGIRIAWTILAINSVLTFTDHLPYLFMLGSWIACATALTVLRGPYWPMRASLTQLALPLLSPILAHLALLHHFRLPTLSSSADPGRTPWPGGRLDWDVQDVERTGRLYGNGEALTCLALCWLPGIWVALGAIAQNWAL